MKKHHNAEKTHCPAGHPYAGANLLQYMDGGKPVRACRLCKQNRAKRFYWEKVRKQAKE